MNMLFIYSLLCVPLYLPYPALALPATSLDHRLVADKLDKRAGPETAFYCGVDSETHQRYFNEYSSKGYRLLSLSSYGLPSSVQYAASWIKRSGPGYIAIHGASEKQYQDWFDRNRASGYVSTIIAATGPGNSAVFSGVMEQVSVSSWVQSCGLTRDNLARDDQGARAAGQMLKAITGYGTQSDRRYCGLWHANPSLDKWQLYSTPLPSSLYQTVFDTETSKPYWRPAYISLSEDQNYTATFTDNSIGPWRARHGLTAAQLQNEYQTYKRKGWYVVHVSGGGSGANTRYAAIFAAQDVPSSRTWRVTGPAVSGFKNNAEAASTVEQAVKTFMQSTGARQVQLSIGKNGAALMDRAYTWSEPERKTTQVQDTFLLASLSKAFLEAAVQSLYDSGRLTPVTKVYSTLGYSAANAADPRSSNITVQQLLDHYGGYSRSISGDPTYNMRWIAIVQNNGTQPASMKDVVDFMYARPLDFTPGDEYVYSNYGYLLLSYLVEHVTQMPYYLYLQRTLLVPEGLNVKPWLTRPETHFGDNVVQESGNTGPTVIDPLSPQNIAAVYGGDGQYKDSALGCASLAANAKSLAKFISRHAVWGNGIRAPGSARSGSTPGASTWMESRWDNVDWALTINTRDLPNGDNDIEVLRIAIGNFLNTDPTSI